MTFKKCSKCYKLKPTSEFYNNKSYKDNLTSYCKDCTYKASKEQRKTKSGIESSRYTQQRYRDQGYYTFGNGAITRLNQSSKSRDHKFNLTQPQLEEWWKSTPDSCHYCNKPTKEFIRLRNAVLASDESNYHIHKFKSLFRRSVHT